MSEASSENQAFELTQGTPVGPATAVSPLVESTRTPGNSFSEAQKMGVAAFQSTLSRATCRMAGKTSSLAAGSEIITAARPAALADAAAAPGSLAVTLPMKLIPFARPEA